MDEARNKLIWDVLMTEVRNPYGVAGVMGNLMAESSMSPVCLTGKLNGMTASEYVKWIQTGVIDEEKFAHDGIAYGLAQWRYWSRKRDLLRFTGPHNIADATTQCRFLLKEIKTYKEVWPVLVDAKSVREASDAVLLKYEKPAGTGEKVREKRAAYGQEFYDKYAGKKTEEPKQDTGKIVVTTKDRVFMRVGNGKNYGKIQRIEKKGTGFFWVATAENGWHAVVADSQVGWISGEFSKVVEDL